jgi:hypothetical protein
MYREEFGTWCPFIWIHQEKFQDQLVYHPENQLLQNPYTHLIHLPMECSPVKNFTCWLGSHEYHSIFTSWGCSWNGFVAANISSITLTGTPWLTTWKKPYSSDALTTSGLQQLSKPSKSMIGTWRLQVSDDDFWTFAGGWTN